MKEMEDAFGRAVRDYLKHGDGFEVVERDDGYIDVSGGPEMYLSSYNEWPMYYKRALRLAHGRVLDIGCGAGRIALYLQEQGLDVTGIDISPLMIKTCKERGLIKAEVRSITKIDRDMGKFDTIVMFGNNFGLTSNFKRARWILKKFDKLTNPGAYILAESRQHRQTTEPMHLEYQKRNIERGRMPGQIRIRIRYKKYKTPWFDYLLIEKEEVEKIVEGTPWTVGKYIDSDSDPYIMVLSKNH